MARDKGVRLANHAARLFDTFIVQDYDIQMSKWASANQTIMSKAVAAQGEWRKTLVAADLRKKAEKEREGLILSLALGMMGGLAFSFVSTSIKNKLGKSYGKFVHEDIMVSVGPAGFDKFVRVNVPRFEVNEKISGLVGGVIDQFEGKGGPDTIKKLAQKKTPDYSNALTKMHDDLTQIETLRTQINNAWRDTVSMGRAQLAYLKFHLDEDWCTRMFLRPAHGNVEKAEAACENFLLSLYHNLRSKAALWNNDPLLTKHTQDAIEQEIWAIWILSKKLKMHYKSRRGDFMGLPAKDGQHDLKGRDIPWKDRVPLPWAEKPQGAKMISLDQEVAVRLGFLGVVEAQNAKHAAAIAKRGVKQGTLDIDGDVDTPQESEALRKWAIAHLGERKTMSARPQTTRRPRAMSLRSLNPAAANLR